MKRNVLGIVLSLITLGVLTVAMAAAFGVLQQGLSQAPAAAPTPSPLPKLAAPITTTVPLAKPAPTPPEPTPEPGTPQPPPDKRIPIPPLPPPTPTPPQIVGPVATVNIPGKDFGKYSPNSRVIVSGRWGKGEGEYGLQLSGGRGGAPSFGLDEAENIYVLDSENERVHKYNPRGERLATYPVGPSHEISVATDGSFYLLDAAKDFAVRAYSPDGKPEASYPIDKELANYPTGIIGLSAEDGRVSVALGSGAHAVIKSEAGAVPPQAQAASTLPGQPARPAGRFVWVRRFDDTSALVKVFRADGTVERQIRVVLERRLASPYLVTDDSGNIYVCAYLFVEGGPPRHETLASQMIVVVLAPDGRMVGKVEAPNINLTESWKPIVVSRKGGIYQRQASREAVAIVRWEMEQ